MVNRAITRLELFDSSYFGGEPEKALVAMSRCLAWYDAAQSSERFAACLAIQMRGATGSEFHSVSREQLARLSDDFKRRLLYIGWHPSEYYSLGMTRRNGGPSQRHCRLAKVSTFRSLYTS
ncbi:MAG: hypothetical protein R3C05_05260 [Pirellulaceae bacterium]